MDSYDNMKKGLCWQKMVLEKGQLRTSVIAYLGHLKRFFLWALDSLFHPLSILLRHGVSPQTLRIFRHLQLLSTVLQALDINSVWCICTDGTINHDYLSCLLSCKQDFFDMDIIQLIIYIWNIRESILSGLIVSSF